MDAMTFKKNAGVRHPTCFEDDLIRLSSEIKERWPNGNYSLTVATLNMYVIRTGETHMHESTSGTTEGLAYKIHQTILYDSGMPVVFKSYPLGNGHHMAYSQGVWSLYLSAYEMVRHFAAKFFDLHKIAYPLFVRIIDMEENDELDPFHGSDCTILPFITIEGDLVHDHSYAIARLVQFTEYVAVSPSSRKRVLQSTFAFDFFVVILGETLPTRLVIFVDQPEGGWSCYLAPGKHRSFANLYVLLQYILKFYFVHYNREAPPSLQTRVFYHMNVGGKPFDDFIVSFPGVVTYRFGSSSPGIASSSSPSPGLAASLPSPPQLSSSVDTTITIE